MIYALDTNIISFLLRPSKNLDVVQQFEQILEQGHEYVIPPLCYYEISWHLMWKKATAQLLVLDRLYKNSAATINMKEEEFKLAAKIKAQLSEDGMPIGKKDGDIFIASHCIVNGYTLVTNNTKDFIRIDGLKLVNWKE
jgi:predicted nucleic acid-binding protein